MKKTKKNEEITTVPELVFFIKDSFQAAQDHVDQKFSKIDEKFAKIDGKFTKIDEKFAKIDGKFEKTVTKQDLIDLSVKLLPREEFSQFKQETDKNFEELKTSVDNLTTSVDGLVKQDSTVSQEEAMITLKLKRHEKWFLQVAEKLGIKLEY